MLADTVVRLVVNGVDLVANVCELAAKPNLTNCQKVDRVTKIALNTLALGSAGSAVLGAPLEVQTGFVATELLGNIVAVPASVFSLIAECEERNCYTWKEVGRCIELMGVRALRALRLTLEMDALGEKKYLALSDEERAKAVRPVYKMEGSGDDARLVHIGDKPVDKNECERNLKHSSSAAYGVGIAEHLGQAQLPSKVLSSVICMVASFVSHVREERHRARREHEHELPLAEREAIPEEFEGDAILSQFICLITRAPIRHPVIDPNTGTMYEQAAIEEWIDLHHTSPLTRSHLEREDLVPARDVQEIIDNQLRVLEAERTAMEQEMREDLERQQHEHGQEIEGAPREEEPPVLEQSTAANVATEQLRAGGVVEEQPEVRTIASEPRYAGGIPIDQLEAQPLLHERNDGNEANRQLQDRLAVARLRLRYFQGTGAVDQ